VEIMKVSIQNSTIKALIHFWDLEYRCFTFGNVDMCSTFGECGLLTKFPQNLYEVYFHQRRNKGLTELDELIKVPDLYKILEKSATSLKWKMIEELFKRRKNDSKYVEEKGKIVALGIFELVLFPKLIGIISLEVTATFVAYKNT